MKQKVVVCLMVALVGGIGILVSGGCESEAGKGAGLGTLAGGGIGAIIGHQSGRNR